MASKKHVAAAAAYTFLELQNMYSARLNQQGHISVR
jgi:hypothetical protein